MRSENFNILTNLTRKIHTQKENLSDRRIRKYR